MIWAILSDVHGRGDRLARVLADARAHGAERILSLGDLGSTHALEMLNSVDAGHVFGNWEASGLRGMRQPYRGQVARWPAQYWADDFGAAHASPVWPAGLVITGVVDYLRSNGLHWTALFPSLLRSEGARWEAWCRLEEADVPLFFHGHTHVQEAWCWTPGQPPTRLVGPDVLVPSDGSRLLVGVGSVGDARDGGGACYALYDSRARCVTWRRV